MNYEVYKRLKEAGWPFKIPKDCSGHGCPGVFIHFGESVVYEPPTLSELVEACGNMFGKLERVGNKWLATYPHISAVNLPSQPDEYVDTPEEAVANLFLSLNNKKNA
jgi:hypothetical protein